jgi:fluoride exporter
MFIKQILLVGLGGMLGSILRYAVALLFKQSGFPWATLLVNLVGAFLIGLVMAWVLKQEATNTKLLWATGFCGGLTTFSALSWENWQLLQQDKISLVIGYSLLSIVAGILAVWLGFKLINQ